MLDQLAIGFAQLAAPVHLGMLALGLLVGLLVAILPGLTLVMGIALALPFTGLISNRTFYFAGPEFIAAEGDVIRIIFEQLWIMEAWAGAHPDEVAALLAPQLGVPVPVLRLATGRRQYGVTLIDAGIIAEQQRIAEVFLGLKLIPHPITVAEAVSDQVLLWLAW